ncbi:hypothetical protein NL676_003908 [Syzygium grande]|nr:hypothetical protein NL676_003908 [Syzygium grande]
MGFAFTDAHNSQTTKKRRKRKSAKEFRQGKTEQRLKTDLKASNSISSNGSVGAAHVGRGIDVVKRRREDKRVGRSPKRRCSTQYSTRLHESPKKQKKKTTKRRKGPGGIGDEASKGKAWRSWRAKGLRTTRCSSPSSPLV